MDGFAVCFRPVWEAGREVAEDDFPCHLVVVRKGFLHWTIAAFLTDSVTPSLAAATSNPSPVVHSHLEAAAVHRATAAAHRDVAVARRR